MKEKFEDGAYAMIMPMGWQDARGLQRGWGLLLPVQSKVSYSELMYTSTFCDLATSFIYWFLGDFSLIDRKVCASLNLCSLLLWFQMVLNIFYNETNICYRVRRMV